MKSIYNMLLNKRKVLYQQNGSERENKKKTKKNKPPHTHTGNICSLFRQNLGHQIHNSVAQQISFYRERRERKNIMSFKYLYWSLISGLLLMSVNSVGLHMLEEVNKHLQNTYLKIYVLFISGTMEVNLSSRRRG